MPTSSAGTPPYQLDCGNGAATHSIPTSNQVSYTPKHKNINRIKTNIRGVNTVRPKTITRVKTSIKPINKRKLPPKTIKQAKASIKPVSKLPAKSNNFHKPKTDIKVAGKTKSIQKVALH